MEHLVAMAVQQNRRGFQRHTTSLLGSERTRLLQEGANDDRQETERQLRGSHSGGD